MKIELPKSRNMQIWLVAGESIQDGMVALGLRVEIVKAGNTYIASTPDVKVIGVGKSRGHALAELLVAIEKKGQRD